MRKGILDLRFIIGLFFAITGVILIVGSFVMTAGVAKSEETNFWAGIVYVAFGIFMIILWIVGQKKEVPEGGEETSVDTPET